MCDVIYALTYSREGAMLVMRCTSSHPCWRVYLLLLESLSPLYLDISFFWIIMKYEFIYAIWLPDAKPILAGCVTGGSPAPITGQGFRPTRIGKVPAGTTIPEYYRMYCILYIYLIFIDTIQTFSVYSLPSTEYSLCYYCHAPSCWALLRPHYGSGPERLPLHLHVPANPAGLVGGSRLLSLLLSPVAQGRVIARYAYWQTRSSPECM